MPEANEATDVSIRGYQQSRPRGVALHPSAGNISGLWQRKAAEVFYPQGGCATVGPGLSTQPAQPAVARAADSSTSPARGRGQRRGVCEGQGRLRARATPCGRGATGAHAIRIRMESRARRTCPPPRRRTASRTSRKTALDAQRGARDHVLPVPRRPSSAILKPPQ